MNTIARVLAIGVNLVSVLGTIAVAKDSSKSTVPANLIPSKNEKLAFSLAAQGTQIYECLSKKGNTTKFEWKFKAPEAELFSRAEKKAGKHYHGPTWESIDGSKVIGEVTAKSKSPNSTAIPWLLLKAKQNQGRGIFNKVTSIQRVDTIAGIAPTIGCNQGNTGKIAKVGYSATYHFYVAKPRFPR